MKQSFRTGSLFAAVAALLVVTTLAGAAVADDMKKMDKMDSMKMDPHTSSVFHGVKVNHGTVTHSKKDGKTVLTLSDDFEMPQTPDPHWQVVDSKGTVYPLDRLTAKGAMTDMGMKDGKFNKSIVLPGYIKDVVKVQIWCAWAETLLGEASFQKALK